MGVTLSIAHLEDKEWSAWKDFEKRKYVEIHHRCRILRKISWETLWNKFLESPSTSFAIAPPELTSLMELSVYEGIEIAAKDLKTEITDYFDFVKERNSLGNEDTSHSKYFDFIAVFTSVLLTSEDHLEEKIDKLFELTDFSGDGHISLDELYLTITSIDRGLSYVLGESPSSAKYLLAVSKKYFSLSEMGRESEAIDSNTQMGLKKFFEFCTNRQHTVRRLLEFFGNANVQKNKIGELQEVVTAEKLSCPSLDEPTGGDEWMSNPAWKKTAEIMTPKIHSGNSSRPVSTLKLEWVHGYRGFDCRNNVRYVDAAGSEFAFTAAALGVVQSVSRQGTPRAQRYFGDHTDDIIALSVFGPAQGTGVTIATGEMGKTPVVHLWKPDSLSGMVSLACMSGFHTKAVCQLTHSTDGSKLFSVGIEYTVAVYNVKEDDKKFGKQICSAQGPKGKIFHATAYGSVEKSTKFLTCGEKHIVFWEIKSGKSSITQTAAKLSREFSNKSFLSAAQVGKSENVVVGAHTGELLLFTDAKKAPTKLQAGPKSVNALWSSGSSGECYLLVGCKEGVVYKYSFNDEGSSVSAVASFKVPPFCNIPVPDNRKKSSVNPIRSVSASADNSKLLIGTQKCEIVEVEADIAFGRPGSSPPSLREPTALSLVAGHFKDEVWGLAIRPPRPNKAAEYASVGDDGYLRIFNAETREQSHVLDMGTMSRCCDYSPDGSMLAVGYGGRVGRGKQKMDGMFRIYRVDTDKAATDPEWCTMIHEGRDAKQWISDIKFSEDGRVLAVGSKDNSIYVYLVAQKFKLKFKFSRHNSYITHFDISKDGQYMQSNCGAYELLFCSVKDGKPILKGSSLSNVEWSTWTCPLGWPVQGIWPSSADGTDINAVDRSPSGKLIATADDFGKVKVFRYPSVELNSQFCEYSGHSSHVTNVRWVPDDEGGDNYVITVGGNDKCLFQWKHVQGEENSDNAKNSHYKSAPAASSSFELEEPSGGDEFMAVKPWKGAIKEPSNFGVSDKTRVVQFFAALGDLSNKHAELHAKFEKVPAQCALDVAPVSGDDSEEDYKQISRCCSQVFERLTDSGYSSKDMPDNDEVELAWVHGYRAFDCRNNLRYADPSLQHIVYFSANVGIVLNKKTREQKYFRGHTDDILSMSTINTTLPNESGEMQIVASGQRGKKNTFVWTVPDMTLISTLETGQKSICMLEFSQDARLLISIAEDNTVAVSDWANQRVVAKVDGEPAPTFHLARHAATGNGPLFLTCGDKFMRLWSLSGRNLTSSKISTAHKKASPQKFLSAVYFSGQWVIGCMDGSLYVIPDGEKKVTRVLLPPPPVAPAASTPAKGTKKTAKAPAKGKAKTKGGGVKLPAITSMFCVDGLLVTGDRTGQVMIWNSELQYLQGISIDTLVNKVCDGMYKLVGHCRQIQSLCCVGTPDRCTILVGTRGCDIVEVQCEGGQSTVSAGSPLIQGHADDELWGLAVHPTRPLYCTVGDDKTLRVWSCHSRRMLQCVSLGNMARACDFSPDGDLIAVGFGGRVGRSSKVTQKNDGMVRIYSSKDLSSMVEIKDAKQWISDVKFSPDGNALAVGSHNNTVYIYDIEQSTAKGAKRGSLVLKIRCKFSKHNSYITHMDFSADSRFLQSNCGAYELLFCDTSNGKQITSATELRDVKWSSWTGCLGWPVQGIWPSGCDGTDINAVCRSHSGHLVATSDDFGMVRVLKYPCIEEGSEALDCAGHSSHVMNVRWTVADEYLISVGGNDKTIFQWKHTISSMDGTGTSSGSASPTRRSEPATDASSFELEEPTGGDEFMAVKPWRGAIRAPEHPPTINPTLPSTDLSLQWVHGYTSGSAGSDNSRISSNLHYNVDNNVIYPAAALGVCLNHDVSNSSSSTQSFFTGHDDDVLCLAISSDRRFVATGQTASKSSKGTGKICIWDAVDCRLLSEMKGAHKRGVVSVAFSPAGDKLLSIGLDNNYTHTLWSDVGGSWSRVQQSATTKSDQKTHLYSLWISEPDSFDCQFVSGGATSVHFWKIEGSAMTKKESRFGKFPQKPILCAAGLHMKEDKYSLVTGSSSGGLYIFDKDRECKNVIENAHSGAIITLVGSQEGDFIISGGSDKCIKIWNHALQAITNCQLGQDLTKSPVNATVASIDYRIDASNNLVVLVGTYGGEIMEISANASEDDATARKPDRSIDRDISVPLNFDLIAENALCLLHSHYSGELWAVAVHPKNPDLLATGGDDSTVRIWSIKQQRMLCCLAVGKDVRAVCWDPEGNILCVGFNGSGGKGKKSKSKGKGKGKGKKAGSKESSGGGKPFGPGSLPDMSSKACAVFSFSSDPCQLHFLGAGCPSGDKWVSDVKISPKGSYLGVGSHSKQLYMYSVPKEQDGRISLSPDRWQKAFSENKGLGKFKPFNKHSSAITHFDFSSDEKYFQSNCQAYELLFGIMASGKQQTKATELSVYNQDIHFSDGDDDTEDRSWASWTCTLGWPVQGIWQESAGGSDINSVDRSNSQTLVATADDFGLVKLFRYPCIDEASKYKSFAGHSSHVTNVRWVADDNTLVSVGGNDKCLFIWKVEK